MSNGVTRESFRNMTDPNDKLNVLYDMQEDLKGELQEVKQKRKDHASELSEHCSTRWGECDGRFKTLESLASKVIGGLIFLNVTIPLLVYIFA